MSKRSARPTRLPVHTQAHARTGAGPGARASTAPLALHHGARATNHRVATLSRFVVAVRGRGSWSQSQQAAEVQANRAAMPEDAAIHRTRRFTGRGASPDAALHRTRRSTPLSYQRCWPVRRHPPKPASDACNGAKRRVSRVFLDAGATTAAPTTAAPTGSVVRARDGTRGCSC
jgi:hypothetical protein